jgi:hypothetical protein
MPTKMMISALRTADNGEQLLSILDSITEDSDVNSSQSDSNSIPTMEMIDF